MSGDHPHLRPLEAAGEKGAPAAPAPSALERAPGTPGRPGWLVPALVAAVLVCAGGWFWQARGAAELEARLAASEAGLARAEARVAILEGHLGSIQGRFATLQATIQSELEALGGLLASEPGSGATEAPASR